MCQVSAASLPRRAARSRPSAGGRCCESWLNFPFSWGMWGKGRLDALELLDSSENLPGERVTRVRWAREYIPSCILSRFPF